MTRVERQSLAPNGETGWLDAGSIEGHLADGTTLLALEGLAELLAPGSSGVMSKTTTREG